MQLSKLMKDNLEKATESDLTSSNNLLLQVGNALKSLPADKVAKASNIGGAYTFKKTIQQGDKIDIPFAQVEGLFISVKLKYDSSKVTLLSRYIRDNTRQGHSRQITTEGTTITAEDLADNRQSYYIAFLTVTTQTEVEFVVEISNSKVALKEDIPSLDSVPNFKNLCGSYTFKRVVKQGDKIDIPFLQLKNIGVSVDIDYSTKNDSDLVVRYIRDNTRQGHSRQIFENFTRITEEDLADNRQSYYFAFLTFSEQEVKFTVNFISPLIEELGKDFISVLVIGNSYSLDSFSYVPFILKNAGVNCKIGVVYKGGNPIATANAEYSTNNGYYFYTIDTRTQSSWNTTQWVKIQDCVKSFEWDVISLQQASTQSVDSSTYAAAKELFNKITLDALKNFVPAWNINHTRKTYDNPSAVLTNCENAIDENPVNLVFPYGTAIFDARQDSALSQIGEGSNLWYSDEVHLQEGLPCYIAACANAQAILNKFFPLKSVVGDSLVPTDSFLTEKSIPDQHGSCVGVTDGNRLKAQRIAICANKFNYTIKSSY